MGQAEPPGVTGIEVVMLLPAIFWRGGRGSPAAKVRMCDTQKRDTENRPCWTCCCLVELGDSNDFDSISC